MDRLEAMSILAAAVETGSFSAAGRRLGMPLPTVSRKVSELEALLKTRLLVRTTRKLVLTDAGAAYLAAARRILELVEDAEALASGEYSAPRGDLILTAPIAFGRQHVLPVAVEFLAEFPQVQVHMRLSDRNMNLVEDHVDMAVRIGALADSSMIATRVGFVRRVVCGSPGYLASHGIPEKPTDLAHHTCVGFSAPASNAAWNFSNPAERGVQAVTVPSRLSVDTAEAAIDAAIAGAGLTNVLSYQVAEAVAQKKLRIVLADFEPAPAPVHLVHAAQGMLPHKMRSFLDFAAPRLRRSLDAIHLRALALPSWRPDPS
ncbi:MAG: LysR family transcriptional regulator [Pseudomonadota bacterium]